MSFGISNNVRCREVRECTPELFWKAVRSPLVSDVCAQIADGLEKVRRGEMVKEDYETLKAGLKKRLPIFTPHATFKNGRRLNADAVPSGLSMYDIDHLPNPREYWVEKSQELSVKNVLRFVVLAHVTPSTEGLRLFFIIPDGMDLVQAQKWMSEQLGDANYDQSVKDLARSSFVVPEGYIIYIDEDKLFADNCRGVFLNEVKDLVNTHLTHTRFFALLRMTIVGWLITWTLPGVCDTPLRSSKVCRIRILSPAGLRWLGASRCRENGMISCIGWLRICGISRIMMRIFCYRLCLGTDFRRRK